jgi:hypothetical protein
MKSKKTRKRLELKKETIARLELNELNYLAGGDGPITGHHKTCICVTYTTRREPCIS